MKRPYKSPGSIALALVCALGSLAAHAQNANPAAPAATATRGPRLASPAAGLELTIPLYQSQVVSLDAPANRVSVANPDVADLVVISPTEFYVLAKDIGSTNVLVWNRDQVASTIAVNVTHDLAGLKARLAALLPGNQIQVGNTQRSIVLSGRVPDAATADAAVKIARTFLAQVQTAKNAEQFKQDDNSRREDNTVGEVINLMEIGGAQQVMLQVKVAEITRSELKRLNAQFHSIGLTGNFQIGGLNGGGRFPDRLFKPDDAVLSALPMRADLGGPFGPIDGPNVKEFAPNDMSIPNSGLFGSYLSSNFLFNMAIDAARESGLARVLAEPTITTLTGQEAKFLSGGEFPIPVPRDRDGIAIEFKEFGVSLKMIPTVLSNGRINVKLDVAVSELQNSSSVQLSPVSSDATFVIPSLTKRSALGTVELADGQTISLAGLINDNMRSVVTKFPGLGSLPVIGALFRSQEWLKGETELVILVTPRLARPIDPSNISLPTDHYKDPTDWEFFGLGRTHGAAR